jgi:hypothetical protein
MDNIPNSTPTETPVANEQPVAEAKPVLGTTPNIVRNKQPQPDGEGGKVDTGTEGDEAVITPKKDDTKPEDDFKTKFSESSKEALRLLEVLKANGIDPATGKPMQKADDTQDTPVFRGEQPQSTTVPLTEDQLKASIPGFENLTESEKVIIRDTKATVKQIAKLQNLVAELYDEREYGKQFKSLLSKPEWKALSDHSDEFKDYAYKSENLQVPMETLAASFLYQKGLANKPKETKPQPTGLEPGSGGGKQGKSDQDGYSLEEMNRLRTTNPKKYMQLARSGKLKFKG